MAPKYFSFLMVVAVTFIVIASIDNATAEYTNVQPCNEVCSRPQEQLNECCRAHNYKADGICRRGNAKCAL
ncbi:unnamed protein product [Orchesella dallaii]|uniref:Diapause-specific peptide n=1 Tax=Orchesella dallaii TaxID=48710 RepID=A0ABP1RS80_9HEXA